VTPTSLTFRIPERRAGREERVGDTDVVTTVDDVRTSEVNYPVHKIVYNQSRHKDEWGGLHTKPGCIYGGVHHGVAARGRRERGRATLDMH
jgi:hypothetical protein